jgi:hypothetical protein
VGRYIRDHGCVVTAYYVSNVEQYLFQDGLFDEFAPQRRDAAGRREEHVHSIGLDALRFRGGGIGLTAASA